MIRTLAITTLILGLVGLGLWLWLRFGGAVWFDTALAFCL